MANTLLRHGTNVEGNVGNSEAGTSSAGMFVAGTSGAGPSGVGGSHTEAGPSGAGGSHTEDRGRAADPSGGAEGSQRPIIPHHCTSCGNICYGPISQFRDDGLLRYVSKNHSLHIIFYLICHSFQLFPNLHRFNYLTIYVNKYTDDIQ